jgi:hypothetical protein
VFLKGLEISVQEGIHIKIKKEVYINYVRKRVLFSVNLTYYFQRQIPKLRFHLQLTKHIHKTRYYCYHVTIHNNFLHLKQCSYYHGPSHTVTVIGSGANGLTFKKCVSEMFLYFKLELNTLGVASFSIYKIPKRLESTCCWAVPRKAFAEIYCYIFLVWENHSCSLSSHFLLHAVFHTHSGFCCRLLPSPRTVAEWCNS